MAKEKTKTSSFINTIGIYAGFQLFTIAFLMIVSFLIFYKKIEYNIYWNIGLALLGLLQIVYLFIITKDSSHAAKEIENNLLKINQLEQEVKELKSMLITSKCTFKEFEDKVIYVDDNNHEFAHVLFPMTKDGYVDIKETKVDPSLQGQGIAAKLLEHAYQVIKSHGYAAKATCSYAVNWFSKHPDRQDILIKEEGK